MSTPDLKTEMYSRAWNYFSLHANQRMTTFNFFIVLATLESTGIAVLISSNQHISLGLGGMLLGMTLCLTSFIFWKLDQRVSQMIKRAEGVLIEIEKGTTPDSFCIFTKDKEFETSNDATTILTKPIWTYGDAHRAIFISSGLLGLGCSLFIGIRLYIS